MTLVTTANNPGRLTKQTYKELTAYVNSFPATDPYLRIRDRDAAARIDCWITQKQNHDTFIGFILCCGKSHLFVIYCLHSSFKIKRP